MALAEILPCGHLAAAEAAAEITALALGAMAGTEAHTEAAAGVAVQLRTPLDLQVTAATAAQPLALSSHGNASRHQKMKLTTVEKVWELQK